MATDLLLAQSEKMCQLRGGYWLPLLDQRHCAISVVHA
jgi:hypothetical protein